MAPERDGKAAYRKIIEKLESLRVDRLEQATEKEVRRAQSSQAGRSQAAV
jgi:hypothetical protein